jgi:tRNA nucleotidyltransferase (CCA-adding enzyme)
LSRRDFTINALAVSVGQEELLAGLRNGLRKWKPRLHDHFGGEDDLAARLIKAVGEPEERFQEDALTDDAGDPVRSPAGFCD